MRHRCSPNRRADEIIVLWGVLLWSSAQGLRLDQGQKLEATAVLEGRNCFEVAAD